MTTREQESPCGTRGAHGGKNSRGTRVQGGAGTWEPLPSARVFCKPKTALQIKVYTNNTLKRQRKRGPGMPPSSLEGARGREAGGVSVASVDPALPPLPTTGT